jgi:uncharacterized protein (TIGR03067 family)
MKRVILIAVGVGWMAAAGDSYGVADRPERRKKPLRKEDLVKEEMKKLEGTWREKGSGFTLLFSGNTVKTSHAGTCQVDPSKNPKEIDFFSKQGKLTLRGIYRLKGDQLTLCIAFAFQRPEKFETLVGVPVSCIVLKRKKK